MITAEEEIFILSRAYIPEHSAGLMTRISGGESYLIDDYFCCLKDDWIIVVGYPLTHDFSIKEFESLIDRVKKRFRPKYLSLMAPEIPLSFTGPCQERESDQYYRVDIENIKTKSSLRRIVNKAGERLTVQPSTEMLDAHHELSLEFIERARPPARVKELLLRMPKYVGHTEGAVVLNAWDEKKKLAAFYVLDLAPMAFSSYVIGCHSKKHYAPGASDLLCFELIRMSREQGKRYVHLGLGVNEGIRRFKKKWGGIPVRNYEMCELVLKKPSILDALRALRR